MECYCDFEPAKVYQADVHVARKQHKCDECHRTISSGERYERVFGIWDEPRTYKTCARCLALREFVTAHVPCTCWTHGNMIDDCMEEAYEYAHEAPGLMFGAYRLKVLIRRSAKFTKSAAA